MNTSVVPASGEDEPTKTAGGYFAEAVPTPNGKYHARFGVRFFTPQFVRRHDGEEAVFSNPTEARLAAYQGMVERLNSDRVSTGKNTTAALMRGSELDEQLIDLGLSDDEFAMIWNTKPHRVAGWKAGAEDIPFPVRWALRLLHLPHAMELAIGIVEKNTSHKPQWTRFKAKISELTAMQQRIDDFIPTAIEHAQTWEREHRGQEHPYRKAIIRFDKVCENAQAENITTRLKALKGIAGILGIADDINAIIVEQNRPYAAMVAQRRRDQKQRERVVLRDERTESEVQRASRIGYQAGQRGEPPYPPYRQGTPEAKEWLDSHKRASSSKTNSFGGDR